MQLPFLQLLRPVHPSTRAKILRNLHKLPILKLPATSVPNATAIEREQFPLETAETERSGHRERPEEN
jgi:hypothetical protein